ncbi:MAG: sugar ABC transporter ATP-binding protein, partial [Anaerolineaceae bacterium]|nr:sugar ABC transporter ATP-binding protein [Anaerolineaceae bacterium]
IILMDEPTSSLSENDVRKLFEIIDRLKKRGVSIIFVSHKIPEVVKISDRIIVLRDGQVSGSLNRQEYSEEKIIQLMVGRDVKLFPKWKPNIGPVVLEVKNLFNKDLIKDVSFSIRQGEIVGLSGLVGSGRSELAHLLVGANKKTSGQIIIDGQLADICNPLEAINHGIALVPEDRKSQGLIMLMNIKKNITLPIINRIAGFLRIIRNKVQLKIANHYIHSLSILTPSLEKTVSTLSGGNQQKVVISKWLSTKPRLLILDEPTRGIDIGAKAEVHKVMKELVKEGMGILMISSEMPEILGMSDRIIVMCQGRITGELTHTQASEEKIMTLATSFCG